MRVIANSVNKNKFVFSPICAPTVTKFLEKGLKNVSIELTEISPNFSFNLRDINT